ncbi:hypothetical protein GCM10007067_22830 [Lysobacter bugurensis]|uniref:histidine kinase n=1 Tax=Cognatilysobacter bugurensis TaxID=543356 RepID=A0A918T1L7_9GAMM|nr:hypothetical protein GCM10007067_22830 [Lysobacter bugurensis]
MIATDCVIIGANPAYLRATGASADDIVGKHIFEAFPPNPADPASTNITAVRDSIQACIATGKAHTSPLLRYAVPREGSNGVAFDHKYWSVVHTPVMDAEGNVAFVAQNPIDVTELYRADQAAGQGALADAAHLSFSEAKVSRPQLHEAMARIVDAERERFQALFDQAPSFIAVLKGPDHVFERANQAYAQLVGHRDLIGKPVRKAMPELEGQGFFELLDRVYRTGEPYVGRGVHVRLERDPESGLEDRFFDFVYQPTRDHEGHVSGIFAEGTDVTDTVNALEALRESEQRLLQLANNIPVLAWMANPDGDVYWYNDRWYEFTGTTEAEMRGWGWQPVIHPDDLEPTVTAWTAALACGTPYEVTVRIRANDGQYRAFYVLASPLRDSAGDIVRWFGTNTDITEAQQAHEQLRAADRRKDEFLAMLAHELRNPLAPIRAAADVLSMGSTDLGTVRKASAVISRQVRHMTSLVDDLLDVSRVTRGLVVLEKTEVNIKRVVADAVEQVRPLVEARRHHLNVHLAPQNAHVRGDHKRLVQVLANLLGNAAKFTPEGGHVAVLMEVEDEQVSLTVVDDGIGMPDDVTEHAFELFAQAERTADRTQGGLGIGLALVKSLVELHGGSVRACSEGLGRGSRFTVCLPRLERLSSAERNGGADHERADGRPLRILIVDDNEDAAGMLALLVEAWGHTAITEYSSRQALARATVERPDVCLLDIGLPDMDGNELARALRRNAATAKATLVAVTGYGQETDRKNTSEAGFDHHLVKPVDPVALGAVLRSVESS